MLVGFLLAWSYWLKFDVQNVINFQWIECVHTMLQTSDVCCILKLIVTFRKDKIWLNYAPNNWSCRGRTKSLQINVAMWQTLDDQLMVPMMEYPSPFLVDKHLTLLLDSSFSCTLCKTRFHVATKKRNFPFHLIQPSLGSSTSGLNLL